MTPVLKQYHDFKPKQPKTIKCPACGKRVARLDDGRPVVHKPGFAAGLVYCDRKTHDSMHRP